MRRMLGWLSIACLTFTVGAIIFFGVDGAWSVDTTHKAVCRVIGVQTDEERDGNLRPTTISRARCRSGDVPGFSWIAEGYHLGPAQLIQAKIDDAFDASWRRSRGRFTGSEQYGDYMLQSAALRKN